MADQSKGREAAIDGLYALPLDEFTAARDELARRLRREGDGDAAAHVKRLRKPSAAAWALNRVRRTNRRQTDRLLEAGLRLREAQERLLAGDDREPLRRAVADERRLVGELAGQAERELAAVGRAASAALQEKLRATLHAVASDPEAREALTAGRLVGDHEASGLEVLVAAPAASKRRKQPSAKADAARERRARRLEERLERAHARQGELEEELAQAGRELERAERAAKSARGRAEKAARAVAELERERSELAG